MEARIEARIEARMARMTEPLKTRVLKMEPYVQKIRLLCLPEVARVILAKLCDWPCNTAKDKYGNTFLKGGALNAPMPSVSLTLLQNPVAV